MTLQRPILNRGGRTKRTLGVQAALEWAFRVEQAQLELPPPKGRDRGRLRLRPRIRTAAARHAGLQGGRRAAQDGQLHPSRCRGDRCHRRRHARKPWRHPHGDPGGRTGARWHGPGLDAGRGPRCVPLEIKTNQHGERATTIVVGTERVKTRGKWRTVEVLACPVTWRPHPEQIASARRGYEDWWQALGWVRDGLIAGGMLREVEVTAAMPKVRPWNP